MRLTSLLRDPTNLATADANGSSARSFTLLKLQADPTRTGFSSRPNLSAQVLQILVSHPSRTASKQST